MGCITSIFNFSSEKYESMENWPVAYSVPDPEVDLSETIEIEAEEPVPGRFYKAGKYTHTADGKFFITNKTKTKYVGEFLEIRDIREGSPQYWEPMAIFNLNGKEVREVLDEGNVFVRVEKESL